MIIENKTTRLLVRHLGPLELDVLGIVWNAGEITSRDVFETMRERHPYGQSTILTVLRRLCNRGALEREDRNGMYHYSATISRDELGTALIDMVTEQVFRGDPVPVIEHLTGRKLSRA